MKIIKYIITFFLFFSSTAHAYEAPDVFLKNSVVEVSTFITQNREILDNNEEFLRNKVDQLIIPKLDIELMSKIVLGKKNWVSMSVPQRKRFQLAFRGLMVRTYMKSLTAFDGEKIEFLPYVAGKRKDVAKVESNYLLSEGEIAVNYRLKLNDNQKWKVFDISIDCISLLKNYRTDFKLHVKKDGILSLIANLENKD